MVFNFKLTVAGLLGFVGSDQSDIRDIRDFGGIGGRAKRGISFSHFCRFAVFGIYRLHYDRRGKHKSGHCHKRRGNQRPFRHGNVMPPLSWTAPPRNKPIRETFRKMFNAIKVVQCAEQRGMGLAPPLQSGTAFRAVRQMVQHPAPGRVLYPTVKHVVEQVSAFLTVHFSLPLSPFPKTSDSMSLSFIWARFRRDFTVPTGTLISSDISDRLLSSK